MANILTITDPDPQRRGDYLTAVRSRLAVRGGLAPASAAAGDTAVEWVTFPGAPVDLWAEPGDLAVVWGEPFNGAGEPRRSARAVRDDWVAGRPMVYGGYHAHLVLTRTGEFHVGTDPLGIFPWYWWQQGPVLLAGTSPELFRHHPLFRTEISIAGLAGILILNSLVEGRALLKGVRRLAPGHALLREPGKPAVETHTYSLPESDQHYNVSISTLRELFASTTTRALTRIVPGTGDTKAMLLSGGLDSRVLAAILRGMPGPSLAITRGLPSDLEMRCARKVARVAGFQHRMVPPNPDQALEAAMERARWEHLANGFRSVIGGLREDLGDVPPRIATGYLFDTVVWSAKVTAAAQSWDTSFDPWFERHTHWGFSPATVAELLGAPQVVDEVMHDLRTAFRNSATRPGWARRCSYIAHQNRFRVGGNLWHLSFLSWPGTPGLDLDVLDLAGGLPLAIMAERVLVKDFLVHLHPDLAAIPVDGNAPAARPLVPRLRHLLADYAMTRTGGDQLRRWYRRWRPQERRYFFRDGDFNAPAWRAVRVAAEPHRRRLHGLVRPDVLDRLLPPPERTVAPIDKLKGAGGAKLLTGLALWASEHL